LKLELFNGIELPRQLGFSKGGMDLSMANTVQHGSLASAMGFGNQVVFIPLRFWNNSVAKRANEYLKPLI
jgi:hypothetical protein